MCVPLHAQMKCGVRLQQGLKNKQRYTVEMSFAHAKPVVTAADHSATR